MSGRKIGSFIVVITILIISLALTLWGAVAATIVSDLHLSIREWGVPTKGAHPHDPAVGKNGDLWFTEQMTNKIGRFDPASQNFKEYPLTGGVVRNMAATPDGRIYLACSGVDKIGIVDPNLK
jgi:virginiamycin B lyase